ncbi:DNA methyltransferase [Halpernia sp. GG3]
MNLFQHIKKLLEQNEMFANEEVLLKNKIVEAGLKLDPALLSLLISDEKAKSIFFQEASGTLVFDKVKFQKFISNKEFLPDSFTSFKNKIGLSANGEYLTETREVVLNFPYKDCILEGGQTKEDQKKQEIFWNETLAVDEIDRLLEPKVFTNWKKFDKDGEHKIDDISVNDNFIIRGNNLIALHCLNKIYKGKVKLIYIDPPYNTGNDSFQYNDSFNHSTWLTFMKNRLEIAWQLLNNDGAFFIQVDDSEFAYLKILCDEIFGRENFRETIVLKSSTESGVNAINVKRGERLFKVKEYILFYSKSSKFRFNPFYTKAEFNSNYKYEVIKTDNEFKVTDLSKKYKEKFENYHLSKAEKDILAKKEFEIYALNNAKNIYSLEKNIKKAGEKFKNFASQNKTKGLVEEFINSLDKTVLMYEGGSLVPLIERIVEEDGKNYFGVLASDLWVDIGTTASTEGGVSFSNGKKPEKLLKRIIEMCTSDGDLVLDYHLGSGTTMAVAHKLNRRYLGVEQLDYGENDSTQRLIKVIDGEQSGISKRVKWTGGGCYVYAEMLENNGKLVDSILNSNSTEDLLLILKKPNFEKSIKYNADLEKLIGKDFVALSFEEQQKIALGIIDKNNLYVPFSEINDIDYKISERTKKLNNQFYNF